MTTRNVALFVALLLVAIEAFAQSDQQWPTAFIIQEDFDTISDPWQPVAGTWSRVSGTYVSSAARDDMSTIVSYRGLQPASPPTTTLDFDRFTLRARMRNPGTLASQRVGLVYQYQNAANFYEVLVSATRTLSLRRVVNGVNTEVFSTGLPFGPGRNEWFDLEVDWNNGSTVLRVNGVVQSPMIEQTEFTRGQVGLSAEDVRATFDNVFVSVPFGDQPFHEDFSDALAQSWTPLSGQWRLAGAAYHDAAVQQTNITLAPIHTSLQQVLTFTLRSRMFNPYAGAGNLVGIVFNYRSGAEYNEVVFSPTGVAKINRVLNGVVQTLATAAYDGAPRKWFDVTFEMDFATSVTVDGVKIFDRVDTNPNQFPEGGVGLITHWAPGWFDDVWFDYGVFVPYAESFDAGLPPSADVRGTWSAADGVLRNSSVNSTSLVALGRAGPDTLYRARLLNEFGNSGNLVGLIYCYQDSNAGLNAGDYYEVVFSATGQVQVRKFIQGVLYTVASGSHDVPPDTWFDVLVVRDSLTEPSGITTTIYVNGEPVISLLQGELAEGRVGVVTHWSKGRFDDLSVTEFINRSSR